jgi:hypothetical protein
MNVQPLVHKEIEAQQVACLKAAIQERGEILPLFAPLRQACGDAICGPPLAIYELGALKDGLLVEVAFPVSQPVVGDEIRTREVEAAQAWTLVHHGPPDTLRETLVRLVEHANAHAGTAGGLREVYLVLDAEEPERNVIEVQLVRHEWDRLLAEGLEATLGTDARHEVMAAIDEIGPESPLAAYTDWIRGAMDRLDGLASDPRDRYEVLSGCAHVFSDHRIAQLRAVYQERGEIDDVLQEMYRDPDWYEDPVRRGNVLHMRKVPFDPEGYKAATTAAERRKAYCHCPFVKPYLDEVPSAMSPTFCWCGSGWYRRLWEGILGEPVVIEQMETLLQGSDHCALSITLPLALEGEVGSFQN